MKHRFPNIFSGRDILVFFIHVSEKLFSKMKEFFVQELIISKGKKYKTIESVTKNMYKYISILLVCVQQRMSFHIYDFRNINIDNTVSHM